MHAARSQIRGRFVNGCNETGPVLGVGQVVAGAARWRKSRAGHCWSKMRARRPSSPRAGSTLQMVLILCLRMMVSFLSCRSKQVGPRKGVGGGLVQVGVELVSRRLSSRHCSGRR